MSVEPTEPQLEKLILTPPVTLCLLDERAEKMEFGFHPQLKLQILNSFLLNVQLLDKTRKAVACTFVFKLF